MAVILTTSYKSGEILIALLCAGVTWIGNKSEIIGKITGIALILFLVWIPINDVRKAILYIKNTV